HEVNEIRAEKIARVANPLAFVAQQQQSIILNIILLTSLKFPQTDHNKLLPGTKENRANQDNFPRIKRSVGYENQRIGNVTGARENVGSSVVQKSRIQCYNCKEFGHVAMEC
nr:hypothetical protein [Tanacetum cinerariifolium]